MPCQARLEVSIGYQKCRTGASEVEKDRHNTLTSAGSLFTVAMVAIDHPRKDCPTMQIQVKLFATLRALAPDNAETYPITPGTTVGDIVTQLAIPAKDAKLIFINGVRKPLDTPLADGDRLGIFPLVGGG
jgi:molybdopterin converting factor small subunit